MLKGRGDLHPVPTTLTCALDEENYANHAAVARALRANRGFRAVSVTPSVDNGHAVAAITLARGTSTKSVSEPLD